MKSAIFWEKTLCSPLTFNRSFGGAYRLKACHQLSSWFLSELIFSTLQMEAIYSSETSVDTQLTTGRYVPEDVTLYNHRSENLKCLLYVLHKMEYFK
jgi:hypothetical protein